MRPVSRALIAAALASVPWRMAVAAAPNVPPPALQAPADKLVDQLVAGMSPAAKVGQLLMVGFGGTDVTPQMVRWIKRRQVGGVALFARNVVDAGQVRALNAKLLQLSRGGLPPFLAVDQEGGGVVRITDGLSPLPGAMVLGATHDPALAYLAGQATAIDLRRLGFSMNLAPVVDVASNPHNPVIGTRALGEDPAEVGELAAWFIRGQQEAGLCSVAKHFPGHGDTQADSHFALPSIDADWPRLEAVELLPFRRAIAAGVDAIMTAHIALPKVAEPDGVPATVSPIILTQMLRRRLGYEGIVMTDGLEMQAIAQRYGTGRAAVAAILAGADVPLVLWSEAAREGVYRALLAAVRDHTITPERLDASVRRILAVKVRRGLLDAPASARGVQPIEPNPWHQALMQQVARRGLTLLRNRGALVPLAEVHGADGRRRRLLVLAPAGSFAARMAEDADVAVVYLPNVPSRAQRREVADQATRLAADVDAVVVAVTNAYQVEMARRMLLARPELPAAAVSLGSPYLLGDLPETDAALCAYSSLPDAQRAAADALLGRTAIGGRLPVSLPRGPARGSGLTSQLKAR